MGAPFYSRFLVLYLILAFSQTNAQLPFTMEEKASMPESVSNNAVCEGFLNGAAFLYSFSGIDSSLDQSGIHLKSWRYNVELDVWEVLDSLPDSEGKIAAGASRVGDIIYIIGGYAVAPNGSETSSDKVHRFDIASNSFLTDGATIPIAIDDHVQAVWRDSLIYVITGWSNTTNVPNVQIYNPSLDTWTAGSAVPNNNLYKVFGASGAIIGDTIYYYGGASLGANFPATFQLRKGVIDPNDPSQISWSVDTLSSDLLGYRTAAIAIRDSLFFIGGSKVSYNYDAIAYNGSGVVAPSSRIVMWNTNNAFEVDSSFTIPMDLRGLAKTGENEFYLVGGIGANGQQSDKLFKFTWRKNTNVGLVNNQEIALKIYPNPSHNTLYINDDLNQLISSKLYSLKGELVKDNKDEKVLDLSKLSAGVYLLKLKTINGFYTHKLIVN